MRIKVKGCPIGWGLALVGPTGKVWAQMKPKNLSHLR